MTTPTEPSPQRLPCDVAAFAVSEPDRVANASLRRIDAQRSTRADVHRFATDVEGGGVEDVKPDRSEKPGPMVTTREGDIDDRGDCVCQVVSRHGRVQAERPAPCSLCDLDVVEVGRRCVGPPVDAAAERDDLTRVAKPIDQTIRRSGAGRL